MCSPTPPLLAETAEAAERWRGRLTILRGVELGEPLENLTETGKLLDAPLDFVPASLHNLPGIDDFYFLNYGEWDIPRLLDQYFAQLLGMVHWGRFDSLCTPDLSVPLSSAPMAGGGLRPLAGMHRRRPFRFGRKRAGFWKSTYPACARKSDGHCRISPSSGASGSWGANG